MTTRPAATIAAAIITTFAMGSIHAFSVLGVTLESTLTIDRAAASAIYSLATQYWQILLGYGVVFGGANGIAYCGARGAPYAISDLVTRHF